MPRNKIECPWCGQVQKYPKSGTLGEPRPCGNCKAEWLITTEPGDEVSELENFEVHVIPNVGEFDGQDTPGFVEPIHAVFWRKPIV